MLYPSPWHFDRGVHEVVDMALLTIIRGWHFREGMPIREIERLT